MSSYPQQLMSYSSFPDRSENIVTQPWSTRPEPTSSQWMDMYWRAIHIIARTYEPRDNDTKLAALCFYQSLSDIVPSKSLNIALHDFIVMTPAVYDIINKDRTIQSFFTIFPNVKASLDRQPSNFLKCCLTDSDSLFSWTFLLHAYWSIISGKPIVTYNTLKSLYDPSNITKEFWGNSVWFILHYSAYYAPSVIFQQWAISYKDFLSCLTFVLPCPVCRKHLRQNLTTIPVDNYLYTSDSVFEYSFVLHNIVNRSLGKPVLSLGEARKIYGVEHQPYILQNASLSKFM